MVTNDDHFPIILQAGAGHYSEVVLRMLVPGSELQNDVGGWPHCSCGREWLSLKVSFLSAARKWVFSSKGFFQ